MTHPPSIDLHQVAKALIVAEITVRAKGKDVQLDKIRDLIYETNDHYAEQAKALLPFLEEMVRTANSEGYAAGYADGQSDDWASAVNRKSVGDARDLFEKNRIAPPRHLRAERIWSVLFNDITAGPDWFNLRERQRLADHLWAKGWRREVRPEDVTER